VRMNALAKTRFLAPTDFPIHRGECVRRLRQSSMSPNSGMKGQNEERV
jgi:hypothetical protein